MARLESVLGQETFQPCGTGESVCGMVDRLGCELCARCLFSLAGGNRPAAEAGSDAVAEKLTNMLSTGKTTMHSTICMSANAAMFQVR